MKLRALEQSGHAIQWPDGETMYFLLAKNKIVDFDRWHEVFASHAEAQREAGLHLLHLLRDAADPNLVVMLFRADDLNRARAFTQTPDASKAGQESGVIGIPELLFLSEAPKANQ